MRPKTLTTETETWLRRVGALSAARLIARVYGVDLLSALSSSPIGYAEKRCRGEVSALLRERGVRSKDIFDRFGFTGDLYWLRSRAKQLDSKESERRATGTPLRRRLR